MKRILTMFAIVLFTFTSLPEAEAKRFGGGGSFGKSFKTSPAPKQQNTSNLKQDKAPNLTANRGGLMGGLLGGILAGGLLAAFFGGAFEGIQFMDILIIGLAVYFGSRLLRGLLANKQPVNMAQNAYSNASANPHQTASNTYQQFEQSAATGGFGTMEHNDVPHNYPPGFDQAAFINGAREHYRILQGAWNHNELNTIQEYVSESLFEDLQAERAKLSGEQHTDVMYVDAEIVRADFDAEKAQLSLQFTGRYRDAVEGIEEDIEDIWHLERDLTVQNAPWLIIGIQG